MFLTPFFFFGVGMLGKSFASPLLTLDFAARLSFSSVSTTLDLVTKRMLDNMENDFIINGFCTIIRDAYIKNRLILNPM